MRLLNKNYFSCAVLRQLQNITFFLLSLLVAHPVAASNESAQTFTLDGQLYQTGTTTRLLDVSAKLTIQIISADGTCLLYEEQQTVNTLTTDGHFTVYVGSQAGAGKRTANDPGRSMNQIFQNLTAIAANSVPGQTCAGGTYTPSAGAVRYFRLIVTPSATNVADTLSPDVVIDSVPAALVAQSVQGLERANILQVNNSGSTVLTQANLEAIFTTPAYANLQSILAGNFMPIDSSGATLPSYAANPAGVANGDIWFDTVTNEIKYKNAAGVQIVGTSSGGISSLTVGSSMSINGSVAGTISSGSGAIDLTNTGVTAGTYTKMTVDAKGRVTAGTVSLVEADIPNLTVAGKVSGNTITAGTISGSAGVNTSGNLITTATVSGLTVQATNLRVYNGANYIQFAAPALGGNVNLTLPTTDGNANEFLKTDGAGVLSWATSTITSTDVTTALGYTPMNAATIFAGDISGPSTAISVDKIKGKAITAGSVSGQMMIYDGTSWVNNIMSGDATLAYTGILTLNRVPVSKGGTNVTTFGNNRMIASNGTGTALQDFTCSLNQVISFDASGNGVCANVTSLSAGILNGGNSYAGDISVGTNDNYALKFKANNTIAMTVSQSGYVGIGTTAPASSLEVQATRTDTSGDKFGADLQITANPASASTAQFYGVGGVAQSATGNSNNIHRLSGVYGEGFHQGTGTVTHLEGGRFETSSSTTTPVTNVRGIYASAYREGAASSIVGGEFLATKDYTGAATNVYGVKTTSQRSSGTIGDLYGFHATVDGSNVANTTRAYGARLQVSGAATSYGIYLDDVDGTNQYGIYQVGANDLNYFAGNIGIGTASPSTALDVSGAINYVGIAAPAVSPANQGRIYYDLTANKFKVSQNGAAYTDLVSSGSGITSLGGQTGATQTLALSVDNSVATPTITSATNAHTWKIPMASNTGTTAGLLNKTDYDLFSAKLGTTTTFAGDVSGTYNATVVQKIQGKDITAGSVSGQMMIYNGTAWTNNVMSGDATLAHNGMLTLNKVPVSKGGTNAITFGNNKIISSNGTGSTLQDFSCSLNQVISFDASGYAVCANVSSLSAAIVNGGNTTGADISIGTNDAEHFFIKTNNTNRFSIDPTNGYAIFGVNGSAVGATTTNTPSILLHDDSGGIPRFVIKNGYWADPVEMEMASLNGTGGIIGTATNHPITFRTYSSEVMRLTATGRLGIGTTVPSTALDISGAFTAQGMSSAPSVSNTNTGRIYYDFSANKFKVSQNGAAYVDLVSAATSAILNGGNTTGADISIGTNDNKTLSFKTNNTIAMTISNGGNVGIGTASPESKLHIVGDGNAVFMSPTTGTNGVATYMLNTGNGSLFGIESASGGWLIAGSNPYASVFGTQSTRDFQIGTNNAIRMTISSAGDTGIGISNPSTKLEVAGTILSKPTAVTNVATTLDLLSSNTFTIPTASGSAFTLSGMVNGGEYTVVITDTTTRTYTFACTGTTKYKPANGATTTGTTSIYSIMSIKNGANYDCYVTWATGYQ